MLKGFANPGNDYFLKANRNHMKEVGVGDWVYKAQNFHIGKWDFSSCDLPESWRLQKHLVKVGKNIHVACFQ